MNLYLKQKTILKKIIDTDYLDLTEVSKELIKLFRETFHEEDLKTEITEKDIIYIAGPIIHTDKWREIFQIIIDNNWIIELNNKLKMTDSAFEL